MPKSSRNDPVSMIGDVVEIPVQRVKREPSWRLLVHVRQVKTYGYSQRRRVDTSRQWFKCDDELTASRNVSSSRQRVVLSAVEDGESCRQRVLGLQFQCSTSGEEWSAGSERPACLTGRNRNVECNPHTVLLVDNVNQRKCTA